MIRTTTAQTQAVVEASIVPSVDNSSRPSGTVISTCRRLTWWSLMPELLDLPTCGSTQLTETCPRGGGGREEQKKNEAITPCLVYTMRAPKSQRKAFLVCNKTEMFLDSAQHRVDQQSWVQHAGERFVWITHELYTGYFVINTYLNGLHT